MPFARPTAVSSSHLPPNWHGSIPALPHPQSAAPNAAVTRLHTGQDLFCSTSSGGRLRPPLLVPRHSHRTLPPDLAPRCLAPRWGNSPIRFAPCPPPPPHTALLLDRNSPIVMRFYKWLSPPHGRSHLEALPFSLQQKNLGQPKFSHRCVVAASPRS